MTIDKQTIIKYIGWLTVSFYVFFQFLIQASSSLMQDDWLRQFGLNHLTVSYLSASFFYTYLFFQIPAGLIYDRYRARTILTVASLSLGLGCLLFAGATSFYFAVFARMLMGAGAAFGFVGMLKITSTLFPSKQFPLMVGISEAFAALATMLGMIAVAWSLTYLSWQQLTIHFAVIVFIITALTIIFIRSPKLSSVKKTANNSLWHDIRSASRHQVVLFAGAYGFFMTAAVTAFTSLWGVAFLTNAYHMTELQAAKVMSIIFLGLALGCPINGYLSKKFGCVTETMQLSAMLSAFFMSLILYGSVPASTLGFLFFILGLLGSAYVQCFTLVEQSTDTHIQATSMSVTNMLIMASAPVLQITIGVILNHNSFGFAHTLVQNYQIALTTLPMGMLIAAGICWRLKRCSQALIFSQQDEEIVAEIFKY